MDTWNKKSASNIKNNLNKLPDRLQIKHLKKSVGYVRPKGLKDFLDEVLSGSIYEKKSLDTFLQDFSKDYNLFHSILQKKVVREKHFKNT